MCDAVTVIEKGRILATGTVQEILETLRQRRMLSVRARAARADGLERFLLEQPGVSERARSRRARCSSSSTAATTRRWS